MMAPGWIDAHCHLTDPRIDEASLDALLARSREAGVTGWCLGGVDPSDWDRQTRLSAKLGASLRTSFGLHPWWVAAHSDAECAQGLEQLQREIRSAHALGELGLDFFPKHGGDETAKQRQREIFRAQLQIAREARKPLVLHVVRAHGPALEDLRANPPSDGGIVHSFTGSYAQAKPYLDLGLTLSLGAALARSQGYETLKQALRRLPREAWVLETDSPDQPSEGWTPASGAPAHEPAALVFIAKKASEILGDRTSTEILDQCRENLVKIFPFGGSFAARTEPPNPQG